MKIKKGFILRQVGDAYIVAAVGKAAKEFNGLITLNETGKLLFEKLEKDAELADLVKCIQNEYEIDEITAKKDIQKFVAKLFEAKIIEDKQEV